MNAHFLSEPTIFLQNSATEHSPRRCKGVLLPRHAVDGRQRVDGDVGHSGPAGICGVCGPSRIVGSGVPPGVVGIDHARVDGEEGVIGVKGEEGVVGIKGVHREGLLGVEGAQTIGGGRGVIPLGVSGHGLYVDGQLPGV